MENVDVVVTVLNESRNIQNLINSLLGQTYPCGIIIVDGGSDDGTPEIVQNFLDRGVILKKQKCSRGEGRNIGVSLSTAPYILFTDGDAMPDLNWVQCMVKNLKDSDLVCGLTKNTGNRKYGSLDRVKIYYKDFEVTLPSMNMGIRRDVFLKVGGFDPSFVTAEDIDLNIRILERSYIAKECIECLVIHNARSNFRGFVRQGFWNGYGRKQLKEKNRDIWKDLERSYFSLKDVSLMWIIRNIAGLLGYAEASFILLIKNRRP